MKNGFLSLVPYLHFPPLLHNSSPTLLFFLKFHRALQSNTPQHVVQASPSSFISHQFLPLPCMNLIHPAKWLYSVFPKCLIFWLSSFSHIIMAGISLPVLTAFSNPPYPSELSWNATCPHLFKKPLAGIIVRTNVNWTMYQAFHTTLLMAGTIVVTMYNNETKVDRCQGTPMVTEQLNG